MEKENTLAPFPPYHVKPEQMYLHAIANRLFNELILENVFQELINLVEREREECAKIARTAQFNDFMDSRTALIIEQAIQSRMEPLEPFKSQEDDDVPQS